MNPGLERMREMVAGFWQHLAKARDLPGLETIAPLQGFQGRILFCGMGGSAIGAELAAQLLDDGEPALDVWRDYGLPHWLGSGDLVIVGSYSGGTEESLSALAEARRRGCQIILITSGGRMAQEKQTAEPLVILPAGFPPRAALGYSLGALLRVLGRLGYLPTLDMDFDEVSKMAAGAWQTDESTLMELASVLQDRFPVLYAGDSVAHAAAVRWKGQLNENAKWPASVAVFPELNHNDIVGWEMSSVWQDRCVLVILRSGLESERIRRRIDLTVPLLADQFAHIVQITAAGRSTLARILSLVHMGDHLSCQLAALRGVDPLPVDRIDELKNGLS